jgi:hypothetical protein
MVSLEVVANQEFNGVSVELDGKSFVRCTFRNCEFVYTGGYVAFEKISSSPNCRWRFRGPAASLLQVLSQAGWEIRPPHGLEAMLDHSEG